MTDEPVTPLEDLTSVHSREIKEALREESRLLKAELVCLLVIAMLVVARQLWLV